MTDYTISNNNGTIKAYNENTQQVEFTSTDARTVFNKVVDTLNSINGGSVLLKRGNYAIVNGSVKLRDNQNWIGEDRDLTIISSRDGNVEVFKRTSSELVNYKLSNITLQGDGNTTLLYTSGSTDCQFENVVFEFVDIAQSPRFIVHFDSVNNTKRNDRLVVKHCRFQGDTAGQDMAGSGSMYGCDISNNVFQYGGGQGIGVNVTVGSKYNNNYFFNVDSNPIGFEDVCECNTVNGNVCISCNGAIKLSHLNTPDNKSINNVCCNNVIEYGNKGIEAGWSEGDIISNNVFRRLRNWAIRGTISGGVISGNQFYETNYDNNSITIAGTRYVMGGIVLTNNDNFTNPRGISISNNYFYASGTDFVIPEGYINGGLIKKGRTGGILVDTNNKSNIFIDQSNVFDNTYNTVINKGSK